MNDLNTPSAQADDSTLVIPLLSASKIKRSFSKENAYYLCTVHEAVTVLYAMRFNGLDAILDRPGTFCLDLMCSVFLIRELVSIT